MRMFEFFQHVNAEMVGGKIKTFWQGAHHIIAEIVDGSPQLTDAGQKLKEDIENAAPLVEPAIQTAADAAIAANVPNPVLAGAAEEVANTVLQDVANEIRPTSTGASAADAKPVETAPNGTDLKDAPVRPTTTKGKAKA